MYISQYVEFERQMTVYIQYAQYGTRCGTPTADAFTAHIKVGGPLDQYGFVVDNAELNKIKDFFKKHTNFSVSCEQLGLAIVEHVLSMLTPPAPASGHHYSSYEVKVKVTGNVAGGATVSGTIGYGDPATARPLDAIFKVIDGKLCYTAPATL